METTGTQSEEIVSEEPVASAEELEEEQQNEKEQNAKANSQTDDRSGFIHGLSVGLGVGCIAMFIIVWISIFFTPQLPQAVTYESLLSIFIYPLIYLLAVGLIALTAGIVREYYSTKGTP